MDDITEWTDLEPEWQAAVVEMVGRLMPDKDPQAHWDSMPQRYRRDMIWHWQHPPEQNGSTPGDPDTNAAWDALMDEKRADGDYQDGPNDIFIDWAAFVKRSTTDRQWLVEGFWPWGRGMALWASAKSGKSELALWCAAKLALGEHPWTGATMDPVDVAYFDFEMNEDDLEERLLAFDFDPDRLEHLHYAVLPPLAPMDIDIGGEQVRELVLGVKAQAVVIDTFSRAVKGDEDKADTVQDFYRYTGMRLKRLDIAYLRVDHAGKDQTRGQRGSSAKRDDVDVIWSQIRTRDGVRLDCTGSSRLSWVGPTLSLDRSETNGILSYASPVVLGWPAGTHGKAAELDQLKVPVGAGRPAAIQALRAAGLSPGKNEVLNAAIKYRRESAGQKRGQLVGTATKSAKTLSPAPQGTDGNTDSDTPDDQEKPSGTA